MTYEVPGRADQLGADLVGKWNDAIQTAYDRLLKADLGSRFFSLDPQTVSSPAQASIQWFADPAEPDFCLGPEVARQLSDWGVRGRHELHNEYCEYCLVERIDPSGRRRPKRVQVTTELREYWVCIAMHEPETVRTLTQNVLGFQPSWEDLYGVSDPLRLNAEQRKREFSRFVAGNGGDDELVDAGVPTQPIGRLNTENALFMTHPINGLDDLLYIVMFGAKPYASRSSSGPKRATREQIFREFGVEHLACRHADPAAAMAAYGAVFEGRSVAFDNPLGTYILSFANDVFLFQGEPVPDSWIRFSRGQEGTYQRLEFGPSDDDPAFLDDVTVAVGAQDEPLSGGFQITQQMEVGPLAIVGEASPVADEEYRVVVASSDPIRCHEASACRRISRLKEQYDDAHQTLRLAPRVMGRME